MLQVSTSSAERLRETDERSTAARLLELQGFLRRQLNVILCALVGMVTLALLYLATAPASYTATATMIIDTRKVQLFQQQSLFNDIPIDSGTIESQVEILKSENIALKVIKDLHLDDDPEFVGPTGTGVSSAVASLFGGDTPKSELEKTREAVRAFQNKLGIRRVGLTYVMELSFRSFNPDRSAEIANAVANAYVVDQLEAKYQAAKRAGVWLQDRLRELREQASAADRAVVDFKTKNDIVDAGGRLMNEQQLAELNSQLSIAKAQTGEANAKLDRITSVLNQESPAESVATVTDTLKSDVISKLRSKYLELSALEADWSRRYGESHLAAVNLRNQMTEIQNSIRKELQRIGETYKSDFEIAKQREQSLQRDLDNLVAQSQVKNQAQIPLRDLESNSQTYRALYDNFLQRYMESVQQQSFPITEARVISAASRPLSKSHPRTLLVLAVACFGGLALGAGIGAWRDLFDDVARSAEDVQRSLGAECIAVVPRLERQDDRKTMIMNRLNMPTLRVDRTTPVPDQSISSAILEAPFSPVAEAIRSIKVAIDLHTGKGSGKIIGITSSLPNEGKSSIAAALARLTAQAGARTILVDCDLRNPSLAKAFELAPKFDLLDVIGGKIPLESALWTDQATGLKLLPALAKNLTSNSSEILASENVKKLFEGLRARADYIIVDLPPIVPVVDVRVCGHLIDSYVVVVEWGKTHTRVVEHAFNLAKNVAQHLVGVALNKADLRFLGERDGYARGYYRNRLAVYGPSERV